MREDRFNRMMEGVKQGADYLKGLGKPSRVFEVTAVVPDVKGIRGKLRASQSEFARMLGISVRTLQNWEQKRRVPEGPARVLLAMAEAYPEQLREVSQKIVEQRATERSTAAIPPD